MTTQTKGNPPLSACHQASVKLVGGVGDFSDTDEGITMHYECSECGQPCDLYNPDNRQFATQANAKNPIKEII